MYEKFGEFNSVEELNEAAAGLKAEGDIKSLRELAEENGIDEDDTEDYINGDTETLATLITAAMGKLEKELESMKKDQIEAMCVFYANFAKTIITENEQVAAGVMKKGARIKGIYDAIYEYAKKHKSGGCFSGATTDRQDKELVTAYYTGRNLEVILGLWFYEEIADE